jgi:proline racemase
MLHNSKITIGSAYIMFTNAFQVIDLHTMGEPTRIVTTGIPPLNKGSMMEKKIALQRNYDHIRTLLMREPRGHDNMFGAVLVSPSNPDADFGVIFMDNSSYLNMCVHGSIGVATAAIKLGWIKSNAVKLDTPAGLVECSVEEERVFIRNVPSFYFLEGVANIRERSIPYIIAFGGSFFALVNAQDLGIELTVSNLSRLSDLGVILRETINGSVPIQHPELDIQGVDLIEFYDLRSHTNVVVFGDGQIDRSPCGTGTCAQLACLFSKRQIQINEAFSYRSILGTEFVGRIRTTTSVGPFTAVVPEIGGKAWVISMGQMILEHDDPFPSGFTLSSTREAR